MILLIHGRGLEEPRGLTSFDSTVERVLARPYRSLRGLSEKEPVPDSMPQILSKVGAKATCDTSPWS
jgi:hypothetical protein